MINKENYNRNAEKKEEKPQKLSLLVNYQRLFAYYCANNLLRETVLYHNKQQMPFQLENLYTRKEEEEQQ